MAPDTSCQRMLLCMYSVPDTIGGILRLYIMLSITYMYTLAGTCIIIVFDCIMVVCILLLTFCACIILYVYVYTLPMFPFTCIFM